VPFVNAPGVMRRVAPPRLAFTGSSDVRRYSLELEFYSWTLPDRQASRETRLANAP